MRDTEDEFSSTTPTCEDGNASQTPMRFPWFKVGKVVQIHRESHSLDVIFFDGVAHRHVPVLTGWGGSRFGFAGLTAPSVDQGDWARKTYPPHLAPASSPSGPQSSAVAHPSVAETAHVGRDIYVVCAQVEGSQTGMTGFVALGFLFPEVCEMMFSARCDEFKDLLLVRHPSDVQIALHHTGELSIQHPADGDVRVGPTLEDHDAWPAQARIHMGKFFAPLDLEGRYSEIGKPRDYDELYKLRENRALKVGIRLEDTAGSWIELDHEKNIIIRTAQDVIVDCDRDVTVRAGRDIIAHAGRNIEAHAAEAVLVTSGTTMTATIGTTLTATVGTTATVTAGAAITLSAPIITLSALSVINLNAPSVLVNEMYDEAIPGGVGRQAV